MTAIKIMNFLDIDANYLFQDEADTLVENPFQIKYDEMKHMEKYRIISQYDTEGKNTIDLTIDCLYNKIKEMQEQKMRIFKLEASLNKHPANLHLYTYMNKIACAGLGFYFEDIPSDTLKAPYLENADFIISVSGDSMEPVYYNGDKLYVRKTKEISTGKIGVFSTGNECFIKEMGIDGLISYNKKYDDIPASENIRVIGEVLGKAE